MLTLRRITAVVALALTSAALSAPAYAKPAPGTGNADCGIYLCGVEVIVDGNDKDSAGGNSSSGGGNGGGNGSGEKPATQPVCTYKKLDPQPPAGSLDWEGHEPGDGAVYEESCTSDEGLFTITRNVWAAAPPAAAAVDPAVLAQRAVDQMVLRGPEIGITPKPGGMGLVGMPVYLWTERGPETYGPNVASASAGGITVTATAKVAKIVWQMGDGKTVTCTTPGTPYKAAYGTKPSPDCGHRYAKPSVAGAGTYHVVATSTWTIDWQATTGQSGQMTQTRQSSVDIRVGELQAVGS
ncbi:ATP/GTP-binding protein [Streptomyces sp. S1]|uniref:ATP/GTP-binding protein n=1 Tax=unclassified Streptomyces TaxID=2593676 RepID=UPI0027D2A3D5|nr:ATP/GTP-binding protein [Streptomyces sp. S1]